jgi:hypothetical protein
MKTPMPRIFTRTCALLCIALPALATAQSAPSGASASSPAATAAPSTPSTPPEARQFDFWVGEWEVYGPNGNKIGTNRVELVAGGYALLENWTDTRGGSGKSLNSYKRRTKQWQQYWIGSGGQTVEYKGGLVDGRMVMWADAADAQGRPFLTRGIWTPNADGTVTQVFETSNDQGLTWTNAFTGLYKKIPVNP